MRPYLCLWMLVFQKQRAYWWVSVILSVPLYLKQRTLWMAFLFVYRNRCPIVTLSDLLS